MVFSCLLIDEPANNMSPTYISTASKYDLRGSIENMDKAKNVQNHR